MARPKQFDPDVAVEQAMEVFWQKGYAATTPQNLADALGIGMGSLYNTFGSKHALFGQALSRYIDVRLRSLAELLEGPAPVKERLRKALEFMADEGVRGCMVVNTAGELAGTDETAVRVVRRDFDLTEGVFQALIEEGQRSGEIDLDRDPVALGSLLLNTMVGLRLLARIEEGPDRLHRVIDATIDSL
ncbi:TetR/AcrR family transcriptional regulator [Streptomyces mirabilis]|uniref:TetR/AcrR family transcriptional regulator n=1 Tax=Streptomyces mirabilis TaxID=68239 RepID=UPI00331C63C7